MVGERMKEAEEKDSGLSQMRKGENKDAQKDENKMELENTGERKTERERLKETGVSNLL